MINLPETNVDECWQHLAGLNTHPFGSVAAFAIFAAPLLFM